MLTESDRVIQDFLTLLEREKDNPDRAASPFTPEAWQDLVTLENSLAESADNSVAIANTILDWCDKYPAIAASLNRDNWPKIRIQMAKKGKPIPPPLASERAGIIYNKALVIDLTKKAREESQK
ncbi:MAG: hypothetical protein AB4290_22805 [Spirulina sp.]